MSEHLPLPTHFASRLLFPFRFGVKKGSKEKFDPDILRLISEHTLDPRKKGQPIKVWGTDQAFEAQGVGGNQYLEDMEPPVSGFLFQDKSELSGRYFRISPDFRGLNGKFLLWPKGRQGGLEELRKPESDRTQERLPVTIQKIETVELFITGLGVGLISIMIAGEDQLGLIPIRKMINALIQKPDERSQVASMSLPHRSDDPETWLKLPPEVRDKIEPPPPVDADLETRLGSAGGEFRLEELCKLLLGPVTERKGQDSFGLPVYNDSFRKFLDHYTVVRFAQGINLKDENLSKEMRCFTLLQGQPGQMPIHEVNDHQRATASNRGAAYFVSDEGIDFDQYRLRKARDKFFIGYLFPYVQLRYLELAKEQAAKCKGDLEKDVSRTIAKLGPLFHLSQFNRQPPHDGYYKFARGINALNVEGALRDVERQLQSSRMVARTASSPRRKTLAAGVAALVVVSASLFLLNSPNRPVHANVPVGIEFKREPVSSGKYNNAVILSVGISNYQLSQDFASLKNPRRDAWEVGKRFEDSGYEGEIVLDPDQSQLKTAFDYWLGLIQKDGLAVLYFCGHGVTRNGDTWLLAKDANLSADTPGISANHLIKRIQEREPKNVVLFLDCCRTVVTKGPGVELEEEPAPERKIELRGASKNFHIIYAAQLDQFAYDGDGEHSPYAQALLEAISPSSLRRIYLGKVCQDLGDRVRKLTGEKQSPRFHSESDNPMVLIKPASGIGKLLP